MLKETVFDLNGDHYLDGMKRLIMIARKSNPSAQQNAQGDRTDNAAAMKHVCLVCGYIWDNAQDGKEGPRRCPACSSTLWNKKELRRHKCKQCSHRWMSKLETPSMCPNCKSKLWDKEMKRYKCRRCNHAWGCRADKGQPRRCPQCGSGNWTSDIIDCMCRRCGYSGKIRVNSTGRCPICCTTLSIYDPAKEMEYTEEKAYPVRTKRSDPETYSAVAEILSSEEDDTKKMIGLIEKAKLHFSDAEILVRYSNNENPVDIARDMNISLNRAIMTTVPVRSMRGAE